MDRSAISRALGKCLAYLACGKNDQATEWANELIKLLRSNGCNINI